MPFTDLQLQTLDDKGNHIRHFYVQPTAAIGSKIRINEPIGFLQDLQLKYRKGDSINSTGEAVHETDIPNHMHLDVMFGSSIAYGIGCFGVDALGGGDHFNLQLAIIFSTPAYVYMGLRQIGKGVDAWVSKKANSNG